MGVDPEGGALDEAIRVDNACLEGLQRDGVMLAMHLCRGNNRSQCMRKGATTRSPERLFNQLNVDVFLLEYESERAGTFDALRFRAPHQGRRAGAREQQGPQLEPKDQLIRRIEGGQPVRDARESRRQPAVRVRHDDGGNC